MYFSAQGIQEGWLALWRWLQRHAWIALPLVALGLAIQIFFDIATDLTDPYHAMLDNLIVGLMTLLRSPTLTAIARAISDLLILPWVLLLLLPVAVYLLWRRRVPEAVSVLVVPAATGLFIVLLKIIFARPRPGVSLIEEVGQSFPSGHATGSVVVYGLLAYVIVRFIVVRTWARMLVVALALAMILTTGLARVYLGVHYPSDVIAGWATGVFFLVSAILLLETWERHHRPQEPQTPPA